MGNSSSTGVSGALLTTEFKLPSSPASLKDQCLRLGLSEETVSLSSSSKTGDSEQTEPEEKIEDEKQADDTAADASPVLEQYLSTQEDVVLDQLLLRCGLISKNEDSSTSIKMSDDSITKPACDATSDLRKLKIQTIIHASHPRFWCLNVSKHPNYSRMKTWLWVHERYRMQVNNFVSKCPETEDDLDKLVKSDHDWLGFVYRQFKAFNKKLEGHTIFEETMLFKFVREKLMPAVSKDDDRYGVIPVNFDVLSESHTNEFPELIKSIQTEFKKYEKTEGSLLDNQSDLLSILKKDNNLSTLHSLMNQFEALLLRHLSEEEETMIGPWLRWSDVQYKQYRSYLSWKYAPMY